MAATEHQFSAETDDFFRGIFSKGKNALNDQKKQQLQDKYKLPNLNAQELAKGLRNAAANGQLDDLEAFIKLGADINSTDNRQRKTALHHALEKRHMSCVYRLIERGANWNIADVLGITAYDYASQNDLSLAIEMHKIYIEQTIFFRRSKVDQEEKWNLEYFKIIDKIFPKSGLLKREEELNLISDNEIQTFLQREFMKAIASKNILNLDLVQINLEDSSEQRPIYNLNFAGREFKEVTLLRGYPPSITFRWDNSMQVKDIFKVDFFPFFESYNLDISLNFDLDPKLKLDKGKSYLLACVDLEVINSILVEEYIKNIALMLNFNVEKERARIAGASLILRGRIPADLLKWIRGSLTEPSPIPRVEVIYAIKTLDPIPQDNKEKDFFFCIKQGEYYRLLKNNHLFPFSIYNRWLAIRPYLIIDQVINRAFPKKDNIDYETFVQNFWRIFNEQLENPQRDIPPLESEICNDQIEEKLSEIEISLQSSRNGKDKRTLEKLRGYNRASLLEDIRKNLSRVTHKDPNKYIYLDFEHIILDTINNKDYSKRHDLIKFTEVTSALLNKLNEEKGMIFYKNKYYIHITNENFCVSKEKQRSGMLEDFTDRLFNTFLMNICLIYMQMDTSDKIHLSMEHFASHLYGALEREDKLLKLHVFLRSYEAALSSYYDISSIYQVRLVLEDEKIDKMQKPGIYLSLCVREGIEETDVNILHTDGKIEYFNLSQICKDGNFQEELTGIKNSIKEGNTKYIFGKELLNLIRCKSQYFIYIRDTEPQVLQKGDKKEKNYEIIADFCNFFRDKKCFNIENLNVFILFLKAEIEKARKNKSSENEEDIYKGESELNIGALFGDSDIFLDNDISSEDKLDGDFKKSLNEPDSCENSSVREREERLEYIRELEDIPLIEGLSFYKIKKLSNFYSDKSENIHQSDETIKIIRQNLSPFSHFFHFIESEISPVNLVKFIYIVTENEEILLQEELFPLQKKIIIEYPSGIQSSGISSKKEIIVRYTQDKANSDRNTHSEIAGGQGVIAAGEMIFQYIEEKWHLVEINNGSGHYRPSADICLPKMQALIKGHSSDGYLYSDIPSSSESRRHEEPTISISRLAFFNSVNPGMLLNSGVNKYDYTASPPGSPAHSIPGLKS